MPLVVPDQSIKIFTEISLGQRNATNLTLKLFVNDYTPDDTTAAINLTEALGFGYSEKILVPANWTITVANSRAVATYPQQSFTFTGALGNLYGYWIEDAAGNLLWVERFSIGAVPIEKNGDVLRITPRLSLR